MKNRRFPIRRWTERTLVAILICLVLDAGLNLVFRTDIQSKAVLRTHPVRFAGIGLNQLDDEIRETLGIQANRPMGHWKDRFLAHDNAEMVMESFSLFGDGWGMFATPAVSDFYASLGCDPGWKGMLIRHFSKQIVGLYSGSNRATGFLHRTHDDVKIVVTGCATCHFGRVFGKDVPGLGNKNIDPYALGQWISDADSVLSLMPFRTRSAASKLLQDRSLAMAKYLRSEGVSNQTEGMVPAALVFQWFYEQGGVPIPADMTPGAVKVPALWGYSEKKNGIFCDGFGDSHDSAWGGMTELSAGNQVENIRLNLERIQEFEKILGDILPPAYPLAIDWKKASTGHRLFSENCQRCHGVYRRDSDGVSLFASPRHCLIDVVGTDVDRLEVLTDEGAGLIDRSPLRDVVRINPNYSRGYFAPRLEGIWARFPYLHNGSVPSLAELLVSPEQRPVVFDLANAGEFERFDPRNVGLTVSPVNSAEYFRLDRKAKSGARDVYDTSRLGHSNRGHAFGTGLSRTEKLCLIEYLKTL